MTQEKKFIEALTIVMNEDPKKFEVIFNKEWVNQFYIELWKNKDDNVMVMFKKYSEDGETLKAKKFLSINFKNMTPKEVLNKITMAFLVEFHLPAEFFRGVAEDKDLALLYPMHDGKFLDV